MIQNGSKHFKNDKTSKKLYVAYFFGIFKGKFAQSIFTLSEN